MSNEDYQIFQRRLLESNTTIMRLAENGQYQDIPSVTEAPARLEVKAKSEEYKELLRLRAERRDELHSHRLSLFHPRTLIEAFIVGAGFAALFKGAQMQSSSDNNEVEPQTA